MKTEPTKHKGYCDVCGNGPVYIFPVILKDESGTGEYCEICVLNNSHVRMIPAEDWAKLTHTKQ